MLEDVTYIMEKCAHGALFRSFFKFPQKRKRIFANTYVQFGKYAHVFPQIFLRISVNKFSAGLWKAVRLPKTASAGAFPHGIKSRGHLQ